jgi:hypothetical protein
MEGMRTLTAALAALILLAPTAQAQDTAVFASVKYQGRALDARAPGNWVTTEPQHGGPSQQWRIAFDDDGRFLQLVHPATRNCLGAPEPDEVRVLECIGAQSQSWKRAPSPEGTLAFANAKFPDRCLTASDDHWLLRLTPCDDQDPALWWLPS